MCYRTDDRLVEGCPVFARFSGELLIRRSVRGGSGTGPVHVSWCVQETEQFPLAPSCKIKRLFSLFVMLNKWSFIPECSELGPLRNDTHFTPENSNYQSLYTWLYDLTWYTLKLLYSCLLRLSLCKNKVHQAYSYEMELLQYMSCTIYM